MVGSLLVPLSLQDRSGRLQIPTGRPRFSNPRFLQKSFHRPKFDCMLLHIARRWETGDGFRCVGSPVRTALSGTGKGPVKGV